MLNERKGNCSEYSGVVEINRLAQHEFEGEEIQTLLAQNFDLEAEEVTVLDWSRLH
ncbi:MAG: hypothetical protein O6946_04690 [Gammaproteobacteria bacterium]|nr:hypothetical protein [Gammaproteobacteria bacterium]